MIYLNTSPFAAKVIWQITTRGHNCGDTLQPNSKCEPLHHGGWWVALSHLGTGDRQLKIPLLSSAGRETNRQLALRSWVGGGTCVSRCLIMHHYAWEPITLPAAWVNIKGHYDSSNINSLAVLTCVMMDSEHKIFWLWLNILKEFT